MSQVNHITIGDKLRNKKDGTICTVNRSMFGFSMHYRIPGKGLVKTISMNEKEILKYYEQI